MNNQTHRPIFQSSTSTRHLRYRVDSYSSSSPSIGRPPSSPAHSPSILELPKTFSRTHCRGGLKPLSLPASGALPLVFSSSDWKPMQAGRTWDSKVFRSAVQPPTDFGAHIQEVEMLDVSNSPTGPSGPSQRSNEWTVEGAPLTLIKVGPFGDTIEDARRHCCVDGDPATNFDLQAGIVSAPPGGVNTRVTTSLDRHNSQISAPGVAIYTINPMNINGSWCLDLADSLATPSPPMDSMSRSTFGGAASFSLRARHRSTSPATCQRSGYTPCTP